MLSTWLEGSLGLVESLEEIKHVKLTIGDKVRTLTKSRITINCPVRGRPTPTVTWRRNGQVIRDGEDYKLLGDANNSLIILKNNKTTDSGVFQCTATNQLGSNSANSAITFLSKFIAKLLVYLI